MSIEELQSIKERNERVERNKAWEVSYTRRLLICAIIYFVAAMAMTSMGVDRPFISALIPPIGYYLSTLSLPLVKQWWIRKYFEKAGS